MRVQNPYGKSVEEIFNILKTGEKGIDQPEAERRLSESGENKLPEGKADNFIKIFLRQFQSPLIYVLLGAAIVVFALGEIVDTLVILFVLIFNAIAGSIQEGRAQNTLLALKKWGETTATVIRGGKEILIPDTKIVEGDIIILQEGEKVPADARVIFENSLKVDEASLTGESVPVSKGNAPIAGDNIAPADQGNMLFKGTHVVAGTATAAVTATGLRTEIGKIAKEISQIDTEIPLKKNIQHLSRLIIAVVVAISVVVIMLGLLMGREATEMFRTAVALAVSIIPEGLPIVITLVLATGVWRMSKRNALVKRLQAVESLGQTRIIAVDKTGTLTLNQMVLQKVYTGGRLFEIGGNGYEPKGEINYEGKEISEGDFANHSELLLAGRVAANCANARLSYLEQEKQWKVSGDPTEAAMLVFGQKLGFHHDVVNEVGEMVFELPFDYKRKYHAVIRRKDKKNFLTAVGAPEVIMNICREIRYEGNVQDFTESLKQKMDEIFAKLAGEGFRVLSFAYNSAVEGAFNPDSPPELTFGGFFAIKDALRSEVKEVVQRVHSVGIRMVMITGDHRLTAEAVAREAHIWKEGDSVLTGAEIEKMNDFELDEKLANTSVFARVTPDHKMRIIEAYRRRGEVVAMTGDGVNDAPSLVAADLGVAMGKIGTEVAKEAADIILLDDNFGTILAAAEEGRSIYKTIKKVILYLFSTSMGEVLVIVGAMILLLPLPILPSQIIWLNFITDGFLVIALAMEPKERGLLKGIFVKPNKWIVDSLMLERIFIMSVVMTLGSLYLFATVLNGDIVKAQTTALTVLAVFQWFNAWNCRSDRKSVFKMNPFSNMYLVAATAIVILLQIAALYTPFLQKILHTQPLNANEWTTIILISSSIIMVEEVRKYIYRKKVKLA